MALSFAKSRGAQDDAPMGEMNTTPLIDVMLVLLIMFITTIPIQTHSVGINLPQAPVDTSLPQPDPIKNKVTIDASGVVRSPCRSNRNCNSSPTPPPAIWWSTRPWPTSAVPASPSSALSAMSAMASSDKDTR